ncbi:MAG: DDE-type integrase/transposase/recombinase [Elusimicrobia bacterium]|nr:DDE-type integrase/transposase/recombinase [Elusimicrobiota bacterium]
MTIIMDDAKITTVAQIRGILTSPSELTFKGQDRRQRYAWIESVLERFSYFKLDRGEKGTVKAYLSRLSGISRAQMTRLIAKCLLEGAIRPSKAPRRRFPTIYMDGDKVLLAETDNAHGRLSGPATKKILEREYGVYGNKRFTRLKDISVAQLYRLRGSRSYLRCSQTFSKTRSVNVAIGVRRKPNPRGRPGYIRVDTVHQGDLNGVKGVYHINLVDEVLQWEIVVCVAEISEAHLHEALEAALACFPFVIVNFHSDNGGEFINATVAKLLNKLLIEQTKSRSNRTNDNALVESKNGSVIRKHMGYWHIDRRHAPIINEFYLEHFNNYLNFHRPCAFATVTIDEKGRRRKKYETYQTPYERLRSIKKVGKYLREGVTLKALGAIAARRSDNETASAMQAAKDRLFRRLIAAGAATATSSNRNDIHPSQPQRPRQQHKETKENGSKSNAKPSTTFRLIHG